MQRLQRLFTQCRALYDQWLVAGGFSANGMFMEGHYCLRESATLADSETTSRSHS
ncbi:hypothetical protein HH682_06180 [Rosenbergiella sp. S61]|uniref:Uncharacterized protein n=1 Tax=Rosenbergiella gaditana TaxID=2726987 RepID=A0ABS5SV86_9GAMM|nr:hypothetical protein [Rosenbergiella gaditana]MBT0724031.1 hypothetical protein [Rosenbergiella gaditana]